MDLNNKSLKSTTVCFMTAKMTHGSPERPTLVPNWTWRPSAQRHVIATASAAGHSTGSDARGDCHDAPIAGGGKQPAARGTPHTDGGADPATTVAADLVGGRVTIYQ